MKLYFSEHKPDYLKYHFPYQVWLLQEEGDDIQKIYESGFLPIRSMKNVYYLSRSVRVNLDKFELSSENRRILNKTQNIEADLFPLCEFDYNFKVQKFCKDYGGKRFSKGFLTATAIKKIFKGEVYNYVFVFKEISSQEVIGYAVCFNSTDILQYAHCFYDLTYLKENLGARMMLNAVVWAKKSNKKFAYLGTCYEEKALYKTEFKGVEFFNGFKWSENLKELKELVRGQNAHCEHLLKNKKYLKDYYEGDLPFVLNNYGVRINF